MDKEFTPYLSFMLFVIVAGGIGAIESGDWEFFGAGLLISLSIWVVGVTRKDN